MSPERTVEEIADQLALRLVLGQPRLINMRAIGLVAADEPLVGHDLEQLQRGRVGGGPLA